MLLGKPVFPLSEHQEKNYLPSLRIPISSLPSPPRPVVSGLKSQGRGQATFEEERMHGGLSCSRGLREEREKEVEKQSKLRTRKGALWHHNGPLCGFYPHLWI